MQKRYVFLGEIFCNMDYVVEKSKTREIIAASEQYWGIPSPPIVEEICVCLVQRGNRSTKSRVVDEDEDKEAEEKEKCSAKNLTTPT